MKPLGSKTEKHDLASTLSPVLRGKALPDKTHVSERQFVSAIDSIVSAFADIGFGLTPFQQTFTANVRTDNIAVQAFEFQSDTSDGIMNRVKK